MRYCKWHPTTSLQYRRQNAAGAAQGAFLLLRCPTASCTERLTILILRTPVRRL